MRMVDLIQKKRDGLELTDEEKELIKKIKKEKKKKRKIKKMLEGQK